MEGRSGRPVSVSTTPLTAEEFRAAVPALLCQKISACCESPPAASCQEDVAAKLDEMFAALTEKVVFDPAEASRCVEALQAIPDGCQQLVDATAVYRLACSAVIHGTVQPGEVCEGVEECQNAPGAQGNTQTGFSGCSILGGSGEETRCRRFLPKGDVGDACERGFEGTDAEVNLCLPTLSCNGAKQCQEKPTLGEACPLNDCVDSVCSGGTCVEGASEGESCEEVRCALGLDCSAENSCVRPALSDAYVGVCLGFSCVDSVCSDG